MLETLRVLKESEFQPLRSLLFVAYSGEGLDGGEWTTRPDVRRFLQAKAGFSNFEVEAVINLRGVGAGQGDRLLVAGSGSQRVAELLEDAARHVGAPVRRADEVLDVGVIYDAGSRSNQARASEPLVRLSWEGWEVSTHRASDTLEQISPARLEDAGQTLSLALMLLGRERQY
jgi:Zn-dependent M28 family amino/carboxypeptidase